MDGLPLVVVLLIYFIPTIVGYRKRNAGAIFALNLLLGWTLIGWIIALMWALTYEEQKPEATPDFDQDYRLDPDDASTPLGQGDYERATQDFDQVRYLDPDDDSTYMPQGDYDRAIRDFDQALQIDPNDASTYFGRGNAYADTRYRDPDQAQSESMDTSRNTYTTMVSGADVERIAHFVVHELNLDLDDRLGDEYGYDNPVLICLDAVLAIQRRYKQFVVPRISRFQQEYPHIRSLSDLKQLIERYGHRRFGEQVWNYRYLPRIQTLELLVNWFLAYQQKHGFADDLEAIRYWAQQPYQEPLSAYGVRGIGIATTQYLRMLTGADTVKPDVRIHQAIEDALGRSVENEEAISLIEEAARRLGVGATTLDHAIWKFYSGN